jgi:hypothetical protein
MAFSGKCGKDEISTKKFRLCGKMFFLTFPRCFATKERILDSLKEKAPVLRYIIASELHEDRTPHIHAFVHFERRLDFKKAQCFDFDGYHGKYETVRDKYRVMKYVSKDGNYISNFDIEEKEKSFLNKKRDLSAEIMKGEKQLHEIVSEQPELLFGYKKLYEDITLFNLHRKPATNYLKRDCLWIWGEPGTGKTTWARHIPGSKYMKAQTKWWDGYQGEDVVVLDDFDLKGECLSHYLKIWSDNWSFNAEIKGSSIKPSYTKFIITSNYHPRQIWKEDTQLISAIERRFTFWKSVKTDNVDTDCPYGVIPHEWIN